jgi:hypothetical protein
MPPGITNTFGNGVATSPMLSPFIDNHRYLGYHWCRR